MKQFFRRRTLFYVFLLIIFIGFLLPQNFVMPVKGADNKSYHSKSFWYYPWGKSGTHKGVDIFAKEGTQVLASTAGIVLYAGKINVGGNIVLMIGPKWRLHYYAHLQTIRTQRFAWRNSGESIGTVGTTGNAKGKPPHLHYSIATMIPYLWRIDFDRQGWKKMFYLNPIEYLQNR